MTDAPRLSILFVGDYPADPRLGSSKVFFKLQEEFRALGHDCEILWTDDIGRRPAGRQLRQVISPWMAGRAIARVLARRRVDVIDAASAEGLGFGVRRRFRGGGPPILVCRSNGLEHLNYQRMVDDARAGLTRKSWVRRIWYPATRLNLVAAAAKVADRMIVLNAQDRAFALRHAWQPAARIALVPHGISQRFLTDAPSSGAERGGGLLFCGSWDRTKGVPYLVSAFDQLCASGEAPRLTVLGPGVPAAQVLELFSAPARLLVSVIDRAPESRVMDEYRKHDALIWPSTYEGFGLVLVEAMSQRLPVIATPVGCATTVVRDGVSGVIVPPRDSRALAAAIRALATDPQRRRALGDAGHDAVTEMSWSATARRTLDVYQSALDGRGARWRG